MSNRKRKSDSDEIRELKTKLKKLERERFRRVRVISSSSDSDDERTVTAPSPQPSSRSEDSRRSRPRNRQEMPPPQPPAPPSRRHSLRASPRAASRKSGSLEPIQADHYDEENDPGSCTEPEIPVPQPIVVQADVHAPPQGSSHNTPMAPEPTATLHEDVENIAVSAEAELEPELSSDILEILGDDPSVPKVLGKNIQKDIAVRFNHIATNGLSKELRKELREKYPVPANCTLIDAPQINPEVKAAISETACKRLGGMEQKQKQLANAISCLGEAITLLIAQENTNPTVLKLLMDTGRLICDSQYSDSLTRRFFILSSLKKEMKDQLLLTKIDSFLFGKDLSETLKSAKAISKSGAELKQTYYPSNTNKQSSWKPNTKPPLKKNNLNMKTPPSSHRSTGNSRVRTPAVPRNQPVSSSRSFRPTSKRSQR